MLIVRSATIALILLFFNCSNALSQPRPIRRDVKQLNCSQPIGRVLNTSDRYLKKGSLLCPESWLHPHKGAKVKVLCYRNRKVIWLGSGVVSSKCVPPSQQQQAQQCTPINRANCPKRKGPGKQRNVPTLLIPYSSAVLNVRPDLSWAAVAGATRYKVQFSGDGVNWETMVSGTTLSYPKEQPPMGYGNVYKVSVIAYGDAPITYSSSVLIVSPVDEAQQVRATVKEIKALNLPPDEIAFDLDILFRGQNLLTEAIDTLKLRVEAGSQEPFIYRILGDRYLEAGLPDSAKQEYTKAAQLAQKADDAAELAKAHEGLKRAALYSQLPTRTKGDQK